MSPLLYSNRSAAALALRRFREAELDAGIAVSLDKTLAKGFFRRAQARMALGRLELAKYDAGEAQRLMPGKATTQLLADIGAALEAELKRKKEEAAGTTPVVVEKKVAIVEARAATVPPAQVSDGKKKAEADRLLSANRAAEAAIASAETLPIRQTFKAPVSAFELETNLAHVKRDPEQLSAYLSLLNAATLPKVLGNALTEEMLCLMCKGFGHASFDPHHAVALLQSVLGAPRCEMVTEFLSDETKAMFGRLFASWKGVDVSSLQKLCS